MNWPSWPEEVWNDHLIAHRGRGLTEEHDESGGWTARPLPPLLVLHGKACKAYTWTASGLGSGVSPCHPASSCGIAAVMAQA